MQRRHAIGALTWGAMVALTLVWWTPSLLLAVARWQGGRARFGAVMMLGRALVAMGLLGAASQLYAAEAERATQAMRAIRAGQRW